MRFLAASGYGQMLQGWEINSITTLESPQHWGPIDLGTDAAGTGALPVSPRQRRRFAGVSIVREPQAWAIRQTSRRAKE